MSSEPPGPESTEDREIASGRTTLAPLDTPQDGVGNVVGNALATNDGGATMDVFADIVDRATQSPPTAGPRASAGTVDSPTADDDGANTGAAIASLASAIERATAAERWELAERLQATLERMMAGRSETPGPGSAPQATLTTAVVTRTRRG